MPRRSKGWRRWPCKTDKIDARVLAELSWPDLVPAIWLPDRAVRRKRELARYRMDARDRTTLRNGIHATLITFGHPCPVSDLFALAGRELLDRLAIPDPWRRNVGRDPRADRRPRTADRALTVELKRQEADQRYIPLLVAAPGCGWISAFTVASEIGGHGRFASPGKLCGYTGLCLRVIQSGNTDRRGRISKHGPRDLQCALFEASMNAYKHPATPSATSAPSAGWTVSAVPRSPRWSRRASSPKPSGTCSPQPAVRSGRAPVLV